MRPYKNCVDKILLVICIIALLVVICAMKIMMDDLSLYIKDMGMAPDKETISKYSEKAVIKFFHIPS